MSRRIPASPSSWAASTPEAPCLTSSSPCDDPREQEPTQGLEERIHPLEAVRIRLEEEVATLKSEQQHFLERYVRLEEQNATLTSLYVACQRLHSQLDRSEVLLAVRELIANLMGCEEYVLFSRASDGWLYRVDSFGFDSEAFKRLAPGAGLIGRAVKTGETYLRQESDGSGATEDESNLTACIPLQRECTVTGAVALFRLLPQKSEYLELDRELFGLLKTHLATVLYCVALHEGAKTRNGAVA